MAGGGSAPRRAAGKRPAKKKSSAKKTANRNPSVQSEQGGRVTRLEAAARMYGTNSPQYRQAQRRFG